MLEIGKTVTLPQTGDMCLRHDTQEQHKIYKEMHTETPAVLLGGCQRSSPQGWTFITKGMEERDLHRQGDGGEGPSSPRGWRRGTFIAKGMEERDLHHQGELISILFLPSEEKPIHQLATAQIVTAVAKIPP